MPILELELFEVQGINVIASFVSSHGMKYILVDVHYVSKRMEAILIPNNEGKSVKVFFKKYIIYRFGTLCAINNDGKSYFSNHLFKDLLEKYSVKHKVATPFHP